MNRRLTIGACAVMVAGCAGSGGTIAEPVAPVESGSLAANDAQDPDFVRTESSVGGADGSIDASGPSTTEFDLAAQPTTPAIPVVPDTGVPGIDSSNAFCRAWSEFAGSFQAVGLVSAIGDPADAIRLEVFAAPAVVGAVLAMDAQLPGELEDERLALVADFAGPYFARASAADALLVDGMGEALAPSWIEQLTVAGIDDPFIEVALPVTVDAALFDTAVESFAAAFPPIVADPSLITDARIPLTEAYLAANCPDGGILSGNDVITNG